MKALVYDVKPEEIIHLIQEARESKEAYLGEHSLLLGSVQSCRVDAVREEGTKVLPGA